MKHSIMLHYNNTPAFVGVVNTKNKSKENKTNVIYDTSWSTFQRRQVTNRRM